MHPDLQCGYKCREQINAQIEMHEMGFFKNSVPKYLLHLQPIKECQVCYYCHNL